MGLPALVFGFDFDFEDCRVLASSRGSLLWTAWDCP